MFLCSDWYSSAFNRKIGTSRGDHDTKDPIIISAYLLPGVSFFLYEIDEDFYVHVVPHINHIKMY